MTEATPFQSILVANRGEIACRVMRTAKALGLRTIAVYSEADAGAPHVQMADDAFFLGPAPVAESYLSIDRIVAAIKATKAEAVHPGYGFLSENAEFAKACEENGVVFIGPNIEAIDIMGDKAKSKRRIIDAGVPCIPGYQGEDQSDATLIAEAKDVGFPLMVKAAAGGGGRGMRLVHDATSLPDAIRLARSEAENAFGSGDLILERAIIEPRHVEIQVFADKFGATIHLGERDCSVQRRHQKVIEEAPCPVMTPDLREKMGAAAVKAAQDINYVGAGTVEFLLDANGAFYFLEMNTRLQVEHPVTEMVTGLDLVALQIRVASGEPLGLEQSDIALEGHAIEARLYAEDPSQDFLPATGPVDLWRPTVGDGVRIDAGVETGGEVSPFYDPMLAKVIAHGATRDEARRKLVAGLCDTALFGVTTNTAFLIEALERPLFVSGEATTAFIEQSFSPEDLSPSPLASRDAAIGAVLLYVLGRDAAAGNAIGVSPTILNWSSATPLSVPYRFSYGDDETTITITPQAEQTFSAADGDTAFSIELLRAKNYEAVLAIEGVRIEIHFNHPRRDSSGQTIQFSIGGRAFELVNLNGVIASARDSAGAGAVAAPMHGMLLDVFVKAGDAVKKGDKLAVLEAMKMQHELMADIDGEIEAVHFEPGVQVAADSLLMNIVAADD